MRATDCQLLVEIFLILFGKNQNNLNYATQMHILIKKVSAIKNYQKKYISIGNHIFDFTKR
jgi:hypothetical protein